MLEKFPPDQLLVVAGKEDSLEVGLGRATSHWPQHPLQRALFDDTKVGGPQWRLHPAKLPLYMEPA